MGIKTKWLSPEEDLTIAFGIRYKVFIEGQGFTIDEDDTDATAYHLLLYVEGEAVGTARVFRYKDEVYKIGRVALLAPLRGNGLGSVIMRACEEKIKLLGGKKARLGAQCTARGFYEKNGYEVVGEEYMDEHCPHVDMEKIM